ncbi:MAG: YqhA family protein [Nitrospiraceae bacterium]|nr:YqhA family protein [Nitrospiraceae bacterium]
MDELLDKSRYLIWIAIIASTVSSAFAFLWGAYKTIAVTFNLIVTYGRDPYAFAGFIEVMDIFLIAIILFIFAIALHELFIGKLALPEWLAINNLQELKVKLSSVIILIMAVTFLKHLVEWRDPQGTYNYGLGVAAVSAALIAFTYFGGKEKQN